MHNNYFFLIKLVEALRSRISGFTFGEIFSQNKDELVIGLFNEKEEFFIKALLSPLFSCLSFPSEFYRAKKNSVDLFPELIGKAIQGVEVFENDRSFRIISDKYSLVFKLYGNRSNILLFNGEDCIKIYKQKFSHDTEIKLHEFNKALNLSYEHFLALNQDSKRFIPTLGKELAEYFESQLAPNISTEEKWKKLIAFRNNLIHGTSSFYISRSDSIPQLGLIKEQDNTREIEDAIEALNTFFNDYTRTFFLQKEKNTLLQQNHQKIKKAENYIKSAEDKLHELVQLHGYDQLANIIMANLHQIKPGTEEAELYDFYNDKNIKIKLKKELTPQKNAENFYRKAKNQKIEIGKLKENIHNKKVEIEKYQKIISNLEQAEDLKSLKPFRAEKETTQKEPEEGFHRFFTGGFEILVGKNAKRNDELTFKVANKNDLWLHAKDSPGSHVIIRQVPGKNPGEKVLEKAASLAAYYSKRKTEGLVPVSYTERKYVRKTKDLAPGQVIVEREKVVLVEPVNWTKI